MNIVFDLDGTLIDSAPDICDIVNTILRDEGKEELSLAQTRSFIGEGAAVLIRRVMHARDLGASDTKEADALHAGLLEKFISRYETATVKSEFYPGVAAALEKLRSAGHRLGLCTNKPEGPTRAVLTQTGLDKVFDAVIAGGMIDSHKPEPDMLLNVLGDMGDQPPLYVGDSDTDAQTAQRAGVAFALFSEGYRKSSVEEIPHNWLFDHFDELPAIVKEALANAAPS